MLVGLGLDPARNHLISGFVDTYIRLNEAEKQDFETELDKITPPEKEAVMQLTTSWKEEGIEEGLKKGQIKTLIQILNFRFGPFDANLETGIRKLSTVQLDELSTAFLSFADVNDLAAWLERQQV
jgi:hypothetical protein